MMVAFQYNLERHPFFWPLQSAVAMIFVVIEEVVSEAKRVGNTDLATMGGMLGFAVMMLLDVAFG